MTQSLPLVSIIVPIYGVEKYIERCVRSLFEQDYDNLEYIFVNDCTPDASMKLLKELMSEYPLRAKQCVIIEHSENKGAAAARRTGIVRMSGAFSLCVDADDFIANDMLSKLMAKQQESNADLVNTAFTRYYGEGKFEFSSEPLKGVLLHDTKEVLLSQATPKIAGILVNNQLYKDNEIYHLDNHQFAEDKFVMIQLYLLAKRVAYIDEGLYFYVKTRENSSSSIFNERHLDDFQRTIAESKKIYTQRGIWQQIAGDFYVGAVSNLLWIISNYPQVCFVLTYHRLFADFKFTDLLRSRTWWGMKIFLLPAVLGFPRLTFALYKGVGALIRYKNKWLSSVKE